MKKSTICLCLFLSLKVSAQNLVLNPSFEDTITCPIGTWAMQCRYWYSASVGSPDYFSEQPDIFCSTSYVPQNQVGFQYARTGIAYVGLGPFVSTTFPSFANRREYIGGGLSDTLKHGHEYCVSFYVSVAEEFKYVVDGIGLYLSVDSAVDYTINTNLSFVPQISNLAGNIIYDTLNWVQISGTYIANGGEKYLTIGNFNDDINTLVDSTSGTLMGAYLFIDDVSVVDCTVGINEIESYKNKIKLMPNPTNSELRIENAELKIKNMEITDVLGNVVLIESVKSDEKNIKINVSNFTKGVYFVKVFSDKGIAIKKFVKE
ncbi:MAG: T9SS type A sorting domain-containing protein [Bacteroidia bacterium]